MRTLILFGILTAFACAQTVTNEAPTQPADTQAASAVQLATTAQFGSNSIQDVTLQGTAILHTGNANSGAITLSADTSGRGKVILSLPSGTQTEYASGHSENSACTWTGTDGKTHDTPAHNCRTSGAWFLPVLPLSTALNAGSVAFSDKGTETQDAGTVEHLSSYRSTGKGSNTTLGLLKKWGTEDLYLDSTTSLPTSLKFTIHPDDNARVDIPVEIRFSDYRDVNGVKIPFRIEKFVNGGIFLEISVTSASFNNGGVTPTTGAAQ